MFKLAKKGTGRHAPGMPDGVAKSWRHPGVLTRKKKTSLKRKRPLGGQAVGRGVPILVLFASPLSRVSDLPVRGLCLPRLAYFLGGDSGEELKHA